LYAEIYDTGLIDRAKFFSTIYPLATIHP